MYNTYITFARKIQSFCRELMKFLNPAYVNSLFCLLLDFDYRMKIKHFILFQGISF